MEVCRGPALASSEGTGARLRRKVRGRFSRSWTQPERGTLQALRDPQVGKSAHARLSDGTINGVTESRDAVPFRSISRAISRRRIDSTAPVLFDPVTGALNKGHVMRGSRRIRAQERLERHEAQAEDATDPSTAAEPVASAGLPLPERNGSALAERGAPRDVVLGLQQSRGNAYVSRLMASKPVVARLKPPSAEQSIGAEPGTAHFTDDPTTADPTDTLALGDQGFTFQMLKEVPKAAGSTFGYYREAHLKTVKPSFTKLDKVQFPYVTRKLTKAQDELDSAEGKGWLEFRTIPSVIKHRQDDRDYWQAKGTQLAADRAKEDALAQNFNASVPRANQTFASLARLEAMEEVLGVKDPKAMSDALVKSMKEVEPMAEGLSSKEGALPLMKATEDVTGAAKRSTQAQKEMQAAWRGMQELLIMDHAAELKKTGAADEKRLGEINEVIAFARNVGATIDVSMTVMSGGATMIEGAGGAPLTPSQSMDLMAAEKPDFSEKTSVEAAKKVGGAITKAMGIEIPTSASGLLETAAKIWYWSELEDIRKRLHSLNAQISMHESVAKEIGLKAKVETFQAKVDGFQLANEELQKHMFDRQRAYLQLGQKLDEAAAKNPDYRKSAPGKGKERFATVMTMVSAVREVLAIGAEAKASFKDTNELWTELSDISEHRASLKGLPAEEHDALQDMLKQQLGFEANVERLTADLGEIDSKAGELMAKMSGGGEASAY